MLPYPFSRIIYVWSRVFSLLASPVKLIRPLITQSWQHVAKHFILTSLSFPDSRSYLLNKHVIAELRAFATIYHEAISLVALSEAMQSCLEARILDSFSHREFSVRKSLCNTIQAISDYFTREFSRIIPGSVCTGIFLATDRIPVLYAF